MSVMEFALKKGIIVIHTFEIDANSCHQQKKQQEKTPVNDTGNKAAKHNTQFGMLLLLFRGWSDLVHVYCTCAAC